MNSTNFEKILTTTVEWKIPEVLVECYKLKIIAGYTVILFIVSMIANPTLIWIVLRNNELMNPANALVLPLSLLSIIGTIIELPLTATSASLCK